MNKTPRSSKIVESESNEVKKEISVDKHEVVTGQNSLPIRQWIYIFL